MGRFGVSVATLAGLGLVAGLVATAPASYSVDYPPDPTPTATVTPTASPSVTESSTATATGSPSPSVTPTPTETIIPPPPVGGATVTLGGAPIGVSITEDRTAGIVILSSGALEVTVDPRSPGGRPLPLDASGTPIVNVGGEVQSTGRGFVPGSPVNFYLLAGSRVIFLGTLEVFSDTTFAGSLPIPGDLAPGTYTLQVNGLTNASQDSPITRARPGEVVTRVISISINVVVTEPSAETKAVRTLVYFDVLSAKLSKQAKKSLDRLIAKIPDKSRSNRIRVVGFVGPSPISSNDESLSRARAMSVAAYMRSKGVKGTYRLVAGGVAKGGATARRADVTVQPINR